MHDSLKEMDTDVLIGSQGDIMMPPLDPVDMLVKEVYDYPNQGHVTGRTDVTTGLRGAPRTSPLPYCDVDARISECPLDSSFSSDESEEYEDYFAPLHDICTPAEFQRHFDAMKPFDV